MTVGLEGSPLLMFFHDFFLTRIERRRRSKTWGSGMVRCRSGFLVGEEDLGFIENLVG